MDLLQPNTIKTLLLKYNTKPSKIMGQNFLIDHMVLDKIIQTAELSTYDIVLEIGPGLGTLTNELAKNSKRVICIEKDRKMIEILKETLNSNKNIEIIQGNALKADTDQLPDNYKLIANIPYYLTSPLIRKFLEAKNRPTEIILMIQKEVAQRICSKPPNMSLLSVSVQFYATPQIISHVPAGCFWPKPKVDSAIIKITPKINADIKEIDVHLFFKIVKAGFSQKRKQLANNLSKSLNVEKKKINEWLLKNNLNPAQRAETLSVEDWINLANNYSALLINYT